jgi:hypothetical protein
VIQQAWDYKFRIKRVRREGRARKQTERMDGFAF